jgi:hypothetical protein
MCVLGVLENSFSGEDRMVKTGWRSISALTLAVLIGMCGVVSAQRPNKQKPRQIPQTDLPPVLPPTGVEAAGEARLEQMTSRSSEGLVQVVHADGAVSMDLEGRFMSVMLATTNADGIHTVSCETGHEALKHATAPPAATSDKAKPAATAPPAVPLSRELK